MVLSDRPLPEGVHARIDELPVFPGVAVRVLSIVRDPKHAAVDVARCIEADPALATRVLALANSALFAPRRPIRTLSHAALYIGERALTGAVVAAAVERFFAGGAPRPRGGEEILWRHSLAVAAEARSLARRVGLDGDRALVLGILHDVGLLYLRSEAAALAEEIEQSRAAGLDRHAAEVATFGADHSTLGGALLASFGLPPDLAHGVMLHHAPPDDAPATEEDCVHAADSIAALAGLAPAEEIGSDPPHAAVMARLGIREEDLAKLRDALPEELRAMEQSLGL